jgi:hypothetical protein
MMIPTHKTHVLLQAVALAVVAFALVLPARRLRHEVPQWPWARPVTLRRTVVSPTLRQPIVPGRSIVWCGSFQLTWNELMEQVEGPIELSPPYAGTEWLNEGILTEQDLPPDAFFTYVDMTGDLATLHERLLGEMGPGIRPQAVQRAAEGVGEVRGPVAYAYLKAEQKFPVAYRRLSGELRFGDAEVRSFGYARDEADRRLREQTRVLDFNGPDDFVVELQTAQDEARLLLAKVPPETTLQATVDSVLVRADAATMPTGAEELRVPVMKYEVDQRFDQIEGRTISGPQEDFPRVLYAGQAIRFSLDEAGMQPEPRSEDAAQGTGTAESRVCVFDKPFLVLLRRGKRPPYFAHWVDNAELLVRAD